VQVHENGGFLVPSFEFEDVFFLWSRRNPSHILSADAASGSDFDYVESESEGEDWSSETSDENDAEMWEQILDAEYAEMREQI